MTPFVDITLGWSLYSQRMQKYPGFWWTLLWVCQIRYLLVGLAPTRLISLIKWKHILSVWGHQFLCLRGTFFPFIFIKSVHGWTSLFWVNATDTIHDLENSIKNKWNILVEHKKLISVGILLQGCTKIEDNDIHRNLSIAPNLPLRGGGMGFKIQNGSTSYKDA